MQINIWKKSQKTSSIHNNLHIVDRSKYTSSSCYKQILTRRKALQIDLNKKKHD